MSKVGRNQPCPCGSGKKYKKCCSPKDEVLSIAEYKAEREFDNFYEDLMDFCQSRQKDMEKAFEAYRAKESISFINIKEKEEQFITFFDWFIFDYIDVNGKTIIEEYLSQRGDQLGADSIKLIKSWFTSHLSIYKCIDVEESIYVVDIFTNKFAYLKKPAQADENITDLKGQLLLLRCIPIGNTMDTLIGFIPLPAVFEDYIKVKIEKHMELESAFGNIYEKPEDYFKANSDLLINVVHKILQGIVDEDFTKLGIEETIILEELKFQRQIITWMHMPFSKLDYITPFEATKDAKNIKKLNRLLNDMETNPENYLEFVIFPLILRDIPMVKDYLGINKKFKTKGAHSFDWIDENDYTVAQLVEKNMQGEYAPIEIEKALEGWYNYTKSELPIYRNLPSTAAAVEYAYNRAFRLINKQSQKDLIAKYNTGTKTISQRHKEISNYMGMPKPSLNENIKPMNRILMEKTMTQMHRLLEGKEFNSIDEVNIFLNANIDKINANSDKEKMTSKEYAQEFIYKAYETDNTLERVRLAKEALKYNPNNVDAYIIMAKEAALTLDMSIELLEKAVALGEKELGEKFIKQNAGKFWIEIETRPYMRALENLAQLLSAVNEDERVIEIYLKMLYLNPNDNQGVRYYLITLLIKNKKYKEAQKLLKDYEEDHAAVMIYNWALLEFILNGDTKEAVEKLDLALQANPYVPEYLLEEEDIDYSELPNYYSLGEETEAMICAYETKELWHNTKGALNWLKKHIDSY